MRRLQVRDHAVELMDERGRDGSQRSRVAVRLVTTDGEAEPLPSETVAHGRAGGQNLAQLDGVTERLVGAVDVDHARGVHGLVVVHRSIAANAVVVLEGKAQRIHQRVTAARAVVFGVLREALTSGATAVAGLPAARWGRRRQQAAQQLGVYTALPRLIGSSRGRTGQGGKRVPFSKPSRCEGSSMVCSPSCPRRVAIDLPSVGC